MSGAAVAGGVLGTAVVVEVCEAGSAGALNADGVLAPAYVPVFPTYPQMQAPTDSPAIDGSFVFFEVAQTYGPLVATFVIGFGVGIL